MIALRRRSGPILGSIEAALGTTTSIRIVAIPKVFSSVSTGNVPEFLAKGSTVGGCIAQKMPGICCRTTTTKPAIENLEANQSGMNVVHHTVVVSPLAKSQVRS